MEEYAVANGMARVRFSQVAFHCGLRERHWPLKLEIQVRVLAMENLRGLKVKTPGLHPGNECSILSGDAIIL